jgi:hypothetical protein
MARFKKQIATDELHQTSQKLYEVLNDWEPVLIGKARAQGSPFPWRSVKDLVKDLKLPKTYRSRTLIRMAKKALTSRHLVSFKRVFRLGELRADLFLVLDFNSIIQRPVIPSNCGVKVLTVVGSRGLVGVGA